LQQVDVVDAESFEGVTDLVPRPRVVTLARLRREEDLGAMLLQPWCEAELRVAV
jgi:hypothetical protein